MGCIVSKKKLDFYIFLIFTRPLSCYWPCLVEVTTLIYFYREMADVIRKLLASKLYPCEYYVKDFFMMIYYFLRCSSMLQQSEKRYAFFRLSFKAT